MVKVTLEIFAVTSEDFWARYHGLAIDSDLREGDFWVTQPDKVIGKSEYGSYAFSYKTGIDLSVGKHTAEYANSGYVNIPQYKWTAKIVVNGKVVAEGPAGRDQSLSATFEVTEPAPPAPPAPAGIPLWVFVLLIVIAVPVGIEVGRRYSRGRKG